MKLIVKENYEEMSKKAADIVEEEIKRKPKAVLGLATGSTPVGMYNELIERCKDGKISFSEVVSFNLDEYVGLDEKDESSYRYFMNEKLFNHIDINRENVHIPDGKAENLDTYTRKYEREIDENGGIDLQVLGVGTNGHIAFIEPAGEFPIRTTVAELTENTIKDNSRFFDSMEEVPKTAISMGIGSILKARKIMLLANGENKREVIERFLNTDTVSTDFPVSFLALHSDVTVIVDKEAYGK